MPELEATVRRRDGASGIDLDGDLDVAPDAALRAAYDQAAGHNPAVPVLNFGRVRYFNSSGTALVVDLLARAEQRPVAAYGLADHFRHIFEITRLSDFMRIHPDEASAVGSEPVPARKEEG